MILFVYRDEVYNENTEHKGVAEIIVGKGRDGNRHCPCRFPWPIQPIRKPRRRLEARTVRPDEQSHKPGVALREGEVLMAKLNIKHAGQPAGEGV